MGFRASTHAQIVRWPVFPVIAVRPRPIKPPRWDPAAAAQEGLAQFDKNGDGAISKDEIAESPGMKDG